MSDLFFTGRIVDQFSELTRRGAASGNESFPSLICRPTKPRVSTSLQYALVVLQPDGDGALRWRVGLGVFAKCYKTVTAVLPRRVSK
ncbi:MAG: hypothetical protein KA773_08300 [Chloroflexi bacterium]|nr:hypothetical protein [Chloroflexota bacterium]